MVAYDTLSEAVNGLKKRGYTIDYNLEFDCLTCKESPVPLKPSEFEITEVYRFEGMTDPADETIVYAISTKDGSVKGTLVNAYGAYSDTASEELVDKLKIKR